MIGRTWLFLSEPGGWETVRAGRYPRRGVALADRNAVARPVLLGSEPGAGLGPGGYCPDSPLPSASGDRHRAARLRHALVRPLRLRRPRRNPPSSHVGRPVGAGGLHPPSSAPVLVLIGGRARKGHPRRQAGEERTSTLGARRAASRTATAIARAAPSSASVAPCGEAQPSPSAHCRERTRSRPLAEPTSGLRQRAPDRPIDSLR